MLTVDSNLITVDSTFITIDVTVNMANQFNILDYTDGPLLKTGQILDHTPPGRTTKDDGGFQRGVAGSKADEQYEILTTGQYAGTTNITVNGFTDAHTNECVLDKVTQLLWTRELSKSIYGDGTEDLFWDDTAGVNEDIFEYCDQANIALLGGFSDWRIPNVTEFLSLFNSTNTAIPNATAFPVWDANDVWTSTTRGVNITQANTIRAASGTDINNQTKTVSRNTINLCRLGIEQ